MTHVTYAELMADADERPFDPGDAKKPQIAAYMEHWRPDNCPNDANALLKIARDSFRDQEMGGILVYSCLVRRACMYCWD